MLLSLFYPPYIYVKKSTILYHCLFKILYMEGGLALADGYIFYCNLKYFLPIFLCIKY